MSKLACYLAVAAFLISHSVAAQQDKDSDALLKFEQSIDHGVVAADMPFLEKAYADDFRFKHGTGLVDTKASWLKTVAESKGKYLSRQIDSVEAEVHGKIGITNGKLTVHRKTDTGESSYMIKYVRVYQRDGNTWKMVSHRTVWQK